LNIKCSRSDFKKCQISNSTCTHVDTVEKEGSKREGMELVWEGKKRADSHPTQPGLGAAFLQGKLTSKTR
jgi:hypothetical protein